MVLYIPSMTIWNTSIPLIMFYSVQTGLSTALGAFVASIAGRKADPNDEGV